VALMGTGSGTGEDRAVEAARAAISSPLLEDLSIDGAHGVLINITGGSDLTRYEVNEASTLIQEAAHEDANIIFGAVIDEDMEPGTMRVTVIATGLDGGRMRRGRPAPPLSERPERAERIERMDNVTPLRREATQTADTTPAASAAPDRERERERRERAPEPERTERPQAFMSPFEEDELDVPTFIRRGGAGAGEDEDTEQPTFLRRQMD